MRNGGVETFSLFTAASKHVRGVGGRKRVCEVHAIAGQLLC